MRTFRAGRAGIGVIPKPARGVWSQESVMMTVVTSPQWLGPAQELTQVMNSCAARRAGLTTTRRTRMKRPAKPSARKTPHATKPPATESPLTPYDPQAAAIDVGATSHWGAVPGPRASRGVNEIRCY